MNHTMNFNGSAMDYIKYKVSFDDKHSIPRVLELVISRDPAKEGMHLKTANTVIEFSIKAAAFEGLSLAIQSKIETRSSTATGR